MREILNNKIKDFISEKISDILPRRILGWVIIRVWAIATIERYTNKAPYEVDWEMAIKAILGKK